jgi:hypothetical protein
MKSFRSGTPQTSKKPARASFLLGNLQTVCEYNAKQPGSNKILTAHKHLPIYHKHEEGMGKYNDHPNKKHTKSRFAP